MVATLKRNSPLTNVNSLLCKVQAEIERTIRRNTGFNNIYKE